MGIVQLPDQLERVVELHVAEGRAASSAAFLEEAVMRLIDDVGAEDTAIRQAVEAGLDDIEAGRVTTVATREDARRLEERLMERLRDRLASNG